MAPICPTCGCSLTRLGITRSEARSCEHEGRRLHFCCQGCLERFGEDPDRYLAEIDEWIVCPTCLAEKPKAFTVWIIYEGAEVHFCRCSGCVREFGAATPGAAGETGGMKVELLYFEGCPSYEALLPELRELLAEQGIEGEIELRRIDTIEDAKRERFLGSPTVRVDGADVDPGAAEREDFGFKCRLYRSPAGLKPTPPEEWIRSALRGGG